MPTEPFEHAYFNWLCAKVVDYVMSPTPSLTYWELLRTFHNTEFAWFLSGDDNRAEDGLDLRREFILIAETPDDPNWRRHPACSVLEMLIAFSRRAEFMTGERAKDWFWEFVDNLGLRECTDGSGVDPDEIVDILDQFVWRTYDHNGKGGILPVTDSNRDQREVEIWYQFSDYLFETGRLS
jgi:hypothetical protein